MSGSFARDRRSTGASSKMSKASTKGHQMVCRKSTRWGRVTDAQPLLKFDEDGDNVLAPEGLKLIRSIKGSIYPVILMGDGRSGKSYLASRLLDLEESFVTSDSCEAVTEGIDALVWPVRKLLKPEDMTDEDEDMHILVLDCEGGNNAMAAINAMVNLFGVIIGTTVIFVSGGMLSEASVQSLGATLAARSLIKLDEGSKLPEQRLVAVVNKTTLKYENDTLEKMLNADQTDQGRAESRTLIKESFAEREFFAISVEGLPTFDQSVKAFCASILRGRKPLTLGGVPVEAEQLCDLLQLVVREMDEMDEVSFPSMKRCVVLDGFLRPEANRLLQEARLEIPDLNDYDPDLLKKDPRPNALKTFDAFANHVADRELVNEARAELSERLDQAWNPATRINDAYKPAWEAKMRTQRERTLALEQDSGQRGGGRDNCADRCTGDCCVQ